MKTKTLLLIIFMLVLSFPLHAQDVAGDLLGRINALRTSLGLAPYTLNAALTAAAQSHAQWMVTTGQVTHIQDNGSNPASRAAAAGYHSQWVSENIYMGGLASPDTAWNFWINSSIHYAGLTSTNYQHIGIASADGEYGHAFVLVFGVPSGASVTTSANTSGTGAIGANADAPVAPPSYIVGVDEFGNIKHELQAGQTLGDVLLTYGYTWEDLPALMELNGLTDEDIRYLEIGEVILVPPKTGTYTPTAPVEATAEATEPALDTTITPADGMLPTPLPENILPTPIQPSPTNRLAEPTTANGLVLPSTFVAPQYIRPTASPTRTLTPSPTPMQGVMVSTLPVATTVAMDRAVNTMQTIPSTGRNGLPFWLIGAIFIQVGILGVATVEFFRRRR